MDPAHQDGCTYWFDGWLGGDTWRHCCDVHDAAYFDNAVTLQSHLELGACVAQTSGGVIMGAAMAVGTTLWWWIRHRPWRQPGER